MAKENTKDFNAMLNNSKDMPKIIELKGTEIYKWGGKRMVIAPPIVFDEVMKMVPKGKVITTKEIRNYLAKKYNADLTDQMTTGIFINIVAWASYQRKDNITPYWRTLKSNGELNQKYPEAFELQKTLLEQEGFKIIEKGIKNKRYFVENYEDKIFEV